MINRASGYSRLLLVGGEVRVCLGRMYRDCHGLVAGGVGDINAKSGPADG